MPRVTIEVDKGEKNEVVVHPRNHVTGNDSSANPCVLKPGQKQTLDIPDEHHLVVSVGQPASAAEEDEDEDKGDERQTEGA